MTGWHPRTAGNRLAIRQGRLLRALLPGNGEVAGLLALMLLTDARRPARVSCTGELVTLDEQDRGAWDRTLIAEGNALVRERIEAVAAGGDPPGRYPLQAAINAVHTAAPSARDTDWSTIAALSTAVWCCSTPRRSSGSTGRSRSPRSTAYLTRRRDQRAS